MPTPRRMLLLVNPFSGAGRAKEQHKKIAPTIQKSFLEVKTIFTERAMHAFDIIMEQDLSQIDIVATISGDGLIHEVVQALFRKKEEERNKVSIAVLPGGTSDGLCKSVCEQSREAYSLNNSYFIAIKGKVGQTDILRCDLSYP